ncbi:hypothetical protein CPB86DRAFT_876615 [Serendipita vermifera]|nr:hypothetical protein CPB86DRAFT_876615 [Serendipita vermifera]
MDTLPYEIVLSIFEVYVHGYRRSPTSLLSVCQRWKAFLLASPTLWTRVVISVDSIHYVPGMLESKTYGLGAYLARSEAPGMDLPLDLELKWLPPKDRAGDHAFTCSVSPLEVFNCPETPCKLVSLRQQQVHDIFTVIFGIKLPAPSARLNRWRTLGIDMSGFWDGELPKGYVALLPIQENYPPSLALPIIHTIILRDIMTNSPHIDLPGLRRLDIRGTSYLGAASSLSSVKMLRFNEARSYAQHKAFPWDSSQVEILEVAIFESFIVRVKDPLPTLTTLIITCSDLCMINWPALASRFNAETPLRTIILLQFQFSWLQHCFHYSPNLHIETWKIGCLCYQKPPDVILPPYVTKGDSCEKFEREHTAARNWLTSLDLRKMKAESLDSCTTRLFEEAWPEGPWKVQTEDGSIGHS